MELFTFIFKYSSINNHKRDPVLSLRAGHSNALDNAGETRIKNERLIEQEGQALILIVSISIEPFQHQGFRIQEVSRNSKTELKRGLQYLAVKCVHSGLHVTAFPGLLDNFQFQFVANSEFLNRKKYSAMDYQ
tara:strand:+ start:5649 stop:6047 length:399 start_codon:yes stop_codon:yes gene_type:complete